MPDSIKKGEILIGTKLNVLYLGSPKGHTEEGKYVKSSLHKKGS